MRRVRTKLLSVRVTDEQFHKLEVIADARKHPLQKRGNVSHLVRLHLVDLIAKWEAECDAKTEAIKKAKRMTHPDRSRAG